MVTIVKAHPEFNTYCKNYNEHETPLVTMEMPFLIKQVLFYICCITKVKNSDSRLKYFLADLESAGLSKTKKFLDVGGMSPDKYCDMKGYKQPANPCLYKGQKKGELAYAIDNIAYQAGSYSYYVDVFGGSGAASTAIHPQDRVKQVYNELNVAVFNLFEVLASEGYVELKKALKELQEDLKRINYEYKSRYDVKEFLNNIGSVHDYGKKREREVLSKYSQKFVFDKESVQKCLRSLPSKLFKELPDKSIVVDGYDLQTIMSWNTYADFINHYETIEKVEDILDSYRKYFNNNRICRVEGDIVDENNDIVAQNPFYNVYKINVIQVKALIFYLYFKNIRSDNKADSIQRAVGEIFLHNLSTQGDITSSSILGFDRNELENKRYELGTFIEKDYDSIIDSFHKRVNRIYTQKLLRNDDFRKVINEFSEVKKGVLFYVDSPYDGTSGYDDPDSKVSSFKPSDMSDLINNLALSKKKFIFSMRACGTSNEIKDRIDVNASIKKNVYQVFEKSKIRNLHVLVIRDNRYDISEVIRQETYDGGKVNCNAEIMLTNYDVKSFPDYKKSKNKNGVVYVFDVYKFSDFMELIDKYMPLSAK